MLSLTVKMGKEMKDGNLVLNVFMEKKWKLSMKKKK
jgi:hypothetical protein